MAAGGSSDFDQDLSPVYPGRRGPGFLSLIQRQDLLEWIKLNRGSPDPGPFLSCPLPLALTVRGKYKNLILALYQKAKTKEEELEKAYKVWQKKACLFNEDLAKFNSCYNLSDILALMDSIEGKDHLKGVLGEDTDFQAIPLLEEKMILRPLDLSEEKGGFFRPLPSLKEIQKPLKHLIDLSSQAHGPEIQKMMRPQ